MASDSTGLTKLALHCGWALTIIAWLGSWSTAAEPVANRAVPDPPVCDPSSIDRVDLAMYFDPEFKFPDSIVVIPNDPIPLWLRALARPEPQLQRMTIDTIALANRRGMAGLEVAIPELVSLLGDPDLDPEVRRAAVAALIELDARQHADTLAQQARQHGAMIASLVEPVLADWKSTALRTTWMQRLGDPTASRASLRRAIEGLAAIGQTDASERLQPFVFNQSSPMLIRLSAAEALGSLHVTGLDDSIEKLVGESESDLNSALLAIRLLQKHDSERSIASLRQLYRHPQSTVRAAALRRLFEIDPTLVEAFAVTAIASSDVNERRLGAKSLFTQQSINAIGPLATLLDDVNPSLRQEVSAAMVALAKNDSLRDEVIAQAMRVLNQNAWRGCQQAAIVLTNLDHKPAGARLVELLSHERGEVMVSSAWGLRRLKLPQHLPAMLERAKQVYTGFRNGSLNLAMNGPESQVAQLFMAFGMMNYAAADPLMRSYLPKDLTLGFEARPAATWALGLIHQGQAPEDLTEAFVARLNDINSLITEDDNVRSMAAISLGRIDAKPALSELRKFTNPAGGFVSMAAWWSVQRMTGERPPQLDPLVVRIDSWFLSPLEKN